MASSANPTRDDFAAMLDESLGGAGAGGFEGRVVKGTITAIENDKAVIDVGLKSEGRVALREFAMPGHDENPATSRQAARRTARRSMAVSGGEAAAQTIDAAPGVAIALR